ncbi:MAG: hypothetical protein AAF840_15355, partial [Bacteroidota bacterium]
MQAVLFLAGLWRRKEVRSVSYRLLQALLVSISVILVHHAVFSSLSGDQPWHYALISFSASAWLCVAPLLYLFVRSLAQVTFRWQAKFWWYFLVPGYFLTTWLLALGGL